MKYLFRDLLLWPLSRELNYSDGFPPLQKSINILNTHHQLNLKYFIVTCDFDNILLDLSFWRS